MPFVRSGIGAAGALVLLFCGWGPALAQHRPAEVRLFEFVAIADDAESLWVNPSGLGIRGGSAFLSQTAFDVRGSFNAPRLRQGAWALRLGGVGLGYRHDRFTAGEVINRRVAHTYTMGLAVGDRTVSLGAAHNWYRGAERETSWDLGMLVRPSRWLSLGLAWRELGTPTVGGVPQTEHLVAGLGLRPWGEAITVAAETRYRTRDESGIDGYRAGVRWHMSWGMEGFTSLELDERGRFDQYRAGVRLRLRRSNFDVLGRGLRDEPGGSRISLINTSFPTANRPPVFQPRGRVVEVTVGGPYVDFPPPGFALFGPERPALQPLLTALRQAREDPAIDGLLVRLRPLSTAFIGPVTALHQELWQELHAFREAGKAVVVYVDGRAGPAELYIASAASEIVVPRLTQVAIMGVNFELQRLRRTLERFHLAWDTLSAGEYKTTFHTLFTDTATAAQRAWIDGLVGRAYEELVGTLAAGRGLGADSVMALADAGLLTAAQAVDAGLIDHVGDRRTAEDRLRRLAGRRPVERLEVARLRDDRWGTPPTVAVVFAQGPIVTGRGGRDPLWGGVSMGSETVARELRRAARVPGVRAVVLRVDSPGGSATASDEILRAVEWVREEARLPVIASMGNMAASGGYWISMKADSIVAERMTVTGSIGVISALPVLEELLDTLRIVNEQWTRGRFADLYTSSRHRTPEEMAQLRDMNLHIYDVFLTEAAEGRDLPVDSMRALAGGRVWFGRDARQVGLVDELGGLDRAIEIAAGRAGIDERYRVVLVREPARRFPSGLLGPIRLPAWPFHLERWPLPLPGGGELRMDPPTRGGPR